MSLLEDSKTLENLKLLDTTHENPLEKKIYKISNRVVYYGSLAEKSLIFFVYAGISFQIGFYIDVFCNKNNYSCSTQSIKSLQSSMNSTTYLVSMIAYLIYPLTAEYNNKVVYNISKAAFCVSILLFNFAGMWWMTFARVLMGFFSEYCQVTGHWMLYQIALPQHREAAIAMMMVMMSLYMMAFSYLSFLDDGSYWTWRVVNSGPALLLVLMILVDLTLLRNVNGLDYLLQTKTEKEVVNQLSTYYEEETARMMLRENNERQSHRQGQRLEALDEERKTFKESSLWERIKAKRNQIIHCSILGLCVVFNFSDSFMSNYVFIGSHILDHQEDVKASKMMIFYSSIGFLVTSIILPILRLNKKRKILLTSNMLVCFLCLVVSGLGYRFGKLWLVRTTFIPVAVSNGFIYNSFLLYLADLCSMDVISIPLALHRLILATTEYSLPVFMSFEETHMAEISFRFFILAAISALCVVVVQFVMFETDGLSPAEITKMFKGEEGEGHRGTGERAGNQLSEK